MSAVFQMELPRYKAKDFEVGKTYGGTVAGEFWKTPDGKYMLMWHYDGRIAEVNPMENLLFIEVQTPARPIPVTEFIPGRKYKHPKLRGYFEKYNGQTWFTSYINGSSYESDPLDTEQFFQMKED